MTKKRVLIIGAGPAGLTAAYDLCQDPNIEVVVIEKNPVLVGGISRTEEFQGYRFDIGGHRFFSKSQEVERIWSDLLKSEMLVRPRKSRIFYQKKFFSYPLKPIEALLKLGFVSSVKAVLSFLRVRVFPIKPIRSFEDWVSNEFGRYLFSIFFKSYTEKVWGMKCSDISADWAKQRIKGVSLASAILGAVQTRTGQVKSFIESFRYPRLGPGMMWQACADYVRRFGVQVKMGIEIIEIVRNQAGEILATFSDGSRRSFDQVICSSALGRAFEWLKVEDQDQFSRECLKLKFRDFITVALIYDGTTNLQDNWIYIHDPDLRVGRVQNYASWSKDLLAKEDSTCYGLEYFCHEGQDFWNQTDDQLIRLAKFEIEKMGLARGLRFLKAKVIRQEKAYPVYDHGYENVVQKIREIIELEYPEIQFVGRNGMHRYNNQDHSMMTGLLAAKNIKKGFREFNVWSVNEDAEYHEVTSRDMPKSLKALS